jgi:SPP1 gp7 family putative phage head morphogenesis protein
MRLLDRLAKIRQRPRAFDPPVYFAGVYRSGLSDQSQPSSDRLLAAHNGWQAIASRAISQRLSTLVLEVVIRVRTESGTVVEEVIDDHPLAAVWDANPVFTASQLLALMGFWLADVGEAYFVKVTDRLRLTRELWPLSPARVEIVTDRDVGIRGYVFHGEGGDIAYQADEVVRIFRPDPRSPFAGLGNLGPQAVAYDAGTFLDETIRAHYQNDATPKVALTAREGASVPQPQTLARFESDWRSRYDARGGSRRGLPAFLPPGFDVHEFASDGLTGNAELMDRLRDRILMANGVPRSILGDVVDVNRAAAETNQFVFDLHTVQPLTALIESALTRQVARDYDAELRVRFAPFVSEDKDFVLRQEQQDLVTKVRTVNQVREDRGLDPVDYGDEPIGSFGDVPYRPDEERELAADDPEAFGAGGAEDDAGDDEPRGRRRALVAGARGAFEPAAAWQRVLAAERRHAPAFARAIREVFARQRDAVLEALTESERSGGQRDALTDLFTPGRWRALFRRVVEPVRRRAFVETAQQTTADLGGRFQFLESAERVLERQGAELMANVDRTTRERVRNAISDGVDAGEGQDQIAGRVREVFRARRDQARTIARTEVLRATQAAQLEGFTQSGVVERKRWNTSQDDAVRDSHDAADGQVVDLDQAFTLGDGERAEAPGIGEGGIPLSARNAINCRCFVTPVFEGEGDV